MAWDFSTDPEWAAQLDWVERVRALRVRADRLRSSRSRTTSNDPVRQALIPPLQKIVKERGLWATHLGPHSAGPATAR